MALSLRQTIIGRLRHRLEQRGSPRLQMALLVALTGGAGFLCSVALLHVGVSQLWLRYMLSVGTAYLAFLMLLWWWLRISGPSYIDARDLTGLIRADQHCDDAWRERHTQRSKGDSSWQDLFDCDFDVDLGLPLLVMVLVLAVLGTLLLAWCYIVYGAPFLFAELLLDGVLAATLYRRLRTLDARYWLETAVRRTFPAFCSAAVIMAAVGFAMAQAVPGARSIGEVLSRWP